MLYLVYTHELPSIFVCICSHLCTCIAAHTRHGVNDSGILPKWTTCILNFFTSVQKKKEYPLNKTLPPLHRSDSATSTHAAQRSCSPPAIRFGESRWRGNVQSHQRVYFHVAKARPDTCLAFLHTDSTLWGQLYRSCSNRPCRVPCTVPLSPCYGPTVQPYLTIIHYMSIPPLPAKSHEILHENSRLTEKMASGMPDLDERHFIHTLILHSQSATSIRNATPPTVRCRHARDGH